MLYIISQYKALFKAFIGFGFAGGLESMSADVDNVGDSGSVLTLKEYQSLLEKYKDNQDELNRLVKEKVDTHIFRDSRVVDILEKVTKDMSESYTEAVEETKKVKEDLKQDVKKEVEKTTEVKSGFENVKFTRVLRRGVKAGDDIKALQNFLIQKGHLSPEKEADGSYKEIDGVFGGGTQTALIKFQETIYGEGHRWADGVVSLRGETMKSIKSYYETESLSETEAKKVKTRQEENKEYGKEAADVVNYLRDVDTFITKFNEVYGGTDDIISRHNGLFGVVAHLNNSDVERLVDELQPDYSKIDKEKIQKVLGIPEDSPKYKDGLNRLIIIGVISAILSGGTSIAYEIFAINFGENLYKGPEVNKVLALLNNKEVNFEKEMKEMYLSEKTTISGVNAILDQLNNENMDTANLKRLADDVFQPNWFQRWTGWFTPENYDDVYDLIDDFEESEDIKVAQEIVAKIYKYGITAHSKNKVALIKANSRYEKAQKEYDEKGAFHHYDDDNTGRTPQQELRSAKYNLEVAQEEFKESVEAVKHLGDTISRYTNLRAKYEQLDGTKFDVEKARNRETEIDMELGVEELTQVTDRLNSNQAFAYKIDTSRLNDVNYMKNMLDKMEIETINGKTSVLSGVIRGVEQHVFGYTKTFDTIDFIKAFKKAEKVDSDYVLSNLGRDRNQKFQGKIDGELFKINLNGKDVFFKDKCTNIVTVVNPLQTTVKDTESFPIVVSFDTGLSSGKSSAGADGNPNSTPGSDDPVIIPNIEGQPAI